MGKKGRAGRHRKSGPAKSRPAEGRTSPRRRPADPDDEFFALARHLLATDDPVDAEMLASMIVATWRRKGVQHDLDIEWAAQLLDAFGHTPRSESLAMLIGLGAVAPGILAARAKRNARLLTTRQVPQPRWAGQVGRAVVTESWIVYDALGDGLDIILGCRYPDRHEHTVLVYIDVNMGVLVKDAFLGPSVGETLANLRVQLATGPEEDVAIDLIDPADAAARIRAALELTDITFPPIETDTYPAVRALLEARLATMPAGGRVPERPEWSEAERDALVAEFLASAEAEMVADYEDREEIAHLLVWHGCDYDGSGEPLRWSPVVAEIVLCDWWPRKVVGDRSLHVQMPAVAKAWVRFAGRRKALRPALIEDTVAAIDAYVADFLDLVDDPGTWGPSKSVMERARAAGVDFSDHDALGAFVDELNRGTAPFSMHAPHAEFEWEGISTALERPVRQMLPEIDRICERALDDEYRRDAYDLVRRLALARPSPLCTGWPYVWAGAVLYYLAQNRDLFRRAGPLSLSADDLALAAGAGANTLRAKTREIRALLDD